MGASGEAGLGRFEAKLGKTDKQHVQGCGGRHPAGVRAKREPRIVAQNELVDAEIAGEKVLGQGEGAKRRHNDGEALASRNERDPGSPACSSHKDAPAARKATAVFAFIVAKPGNRLLKRAILKSQPPITAAPTHATARDPARTNQSRRER
jgi:hypothetical protein